MKITSLLLACTLCASAAFAAGDVYTWKGRNGGNSYSAVPRRLQPEHSGIVNIRTHSVSPAAVKPASAAGTGSLAEQQAKLNDQIAMQNKQVEEQNKKIEEENRQRQEDNCKAARLNRQFAETARSNNREALIQRYESDVKRYCN